MEKKPAPIGERYGSLVVLGDGNPHETFRATTSTRNAYISYSRTFRVQCDCGATVDKLASNVLAGRTTSCGHASTKLTPDTEHTLPQKAGTMRAYQLGCRCTLCKGAQRITHRKYRARRKREWGTDV